MDIFIVTPQLNEKRLPIITIIVKNRLGCLNADQHANPPNLLNPPNSLNLPSPSNPPKPRFKDSLRIITFDKS